MARKVEPMSIIAMPTIDIMDGFFLSIISRNSAVIMGMKPFCMIPASATGIVFNPVKLRAAYGIPAEIVANRICHFQLICLGHNFHANGATAIIPVVYRRSIRSMTPIPSDIPTRLSTSHPAHRHMHAIAAVAPSQYLFWDSFSAISFLIL